ncbi:hypothetical protein RsTz2092_06400 [Deferribacterales bacterium RsTz2092]|nr:hypothetical protein AGMMS49941_06540 [Deferribacterales bacterium]
MEAVKHRKLTLDEEMDLAERAVELRKAGKKEEAARLIRQIPMPPRVAMAFKETSGKDFLIRNGYNLVEANERYGENWLNQ